ncbi:UvrD-helicase domain-containing protein [Streptomyces drozdowiczii]|uniref:UvrD-helicase domain-containing protein n=1 Tax=Streptomyces drozdowiczii TaxID=202862 RepID=UPI00403C6891
MASNEPVLSALTTEQLAAIGGASRRLYIEAAPGSGKTTVSAHRYGIQRFGRTADPRAVVAVSFTRSATAELRDRVLARWGNSALSWPHRIVTLDTIMCDLLTHLLHEKAVHWPGGHHELLVHDSWRARLPPSNSRRRPIIRLQGNQVSATTVRAEPYEHAVDRAAFEAAVEAGECTHDDVRTVLETGIKDETVRGALIRHLASTTRALLVDEVFDANLLDLKVVQLAIHAGLQVTLVGDPWQALYGFRGARPEAVPGFIAAEAFKQRDLHHSFRWITRDQDLLSTQLRSGESTFLTPGEVQKVEVVLAREWKSLWATSPRVLPLAFRSATGRPPEAAATLLLNEMTTHAFSQKAIYLADAYTTLGITDPEAGARLQPRLEAILRRLSGDDDLDAIRRELNSAIATESDVRMPRRHSSHIERLAALRTRLQQPSRRPVLGLTCHQAKGREWDHVGVRLEPTDVQALRQGLAHTNEDHRMLYVALTRARRQTLAV